MQKNIAIIGSGFASLAAAATLAKNGYLVNVYEKNEQTGGRARMWEKDGFRFDMGPSWYWMPEVFENFYQQFGKTTSDFYELKRLDPSYRIYFGKNDEMDVPASMPALEQLFEQLEPGSSKNLRKFLAQAKYKYEVGMNEFVHKPSHSITEFFDFRIVSQGINLQLFQNMRAHVRSLFKNERLQKLLEFPVLFLGATPQNTPALYSLMNYADLALGTWYPMHGMHEIVKAMTKICTDQGVVFHLNEEVTGINIQQKKVKSIITTKGEYPVDAVIAGSDYEHTEQKILPKEYRNYDQKYWESRTLSPSSLLFYIGLDKKIDGIKHHNLFFDADFEKHAHEIYTEPAWPSKPLFYVSCTSKTDPKVAPEGKENLFILIPLAPGLQDTEELRERYYHMVLDRLENLVGQKIRGHEMVKRSYAMQDFTDDYHSYKGNAYGLANTLLQTAFLKPKIKARKIDNMFFAGQLTTPGPGVPPSIISGQVAAKELLKVLKNN